jgi:hypothetical protein
LFPKEQSLKRKGRYKQQKAAKNTSLLLLMSSSTDESFLGITFRGARQIQLTSYGHEHGEKPIRDDHSLLPYAHGNHACLRDDDCEAEMFFSFFLFIF